MQMQSSARWPSFEFFMGLEPVKIIKRIKLAKKSKKSTKSKTSKTLKTFTSLVKGNAANPPKFADLKVYAPHNQTFNIFPYNTFPTKLESILLFIKSGLREQNTFYSMFLKIREKDPKLKKLYKDSMDSFWSPGENISKVLTTHINKIRRARRHFRNLLHRWRASRLRIINTEDIATMEIPKDPIYIVDWPSRSASVFEASTLMRDITTRLLHHDGFFDNPQNPRNPFTNNPLTLAQTISVWIQLERSKVSASSVFTGFRQVRWNMYNFMMEYCVPLQLHAFRTTMRCLTHLDYTERMLDFIQYCYEQDNDHCPVHLFEYALKYYPAHNLLNQWAKLCILFYEAPLIHIKNNFRIHAIQEDVIIKSQPLIRRDKEIDDL